MYCKYICLVNHPPCCRFLRERERKLVARQTATEELERKIQLKHDESAKRHGIQLEQIREKAALVSRHASSEDSLRVTPYDKRRWCRVCQVMVSVCE